MKKNIDHPENPEPYILHCLNCNKDYDWRIQGAICPHEGEERRIDKLSPWPKKSLRSQRDQEIESLRAEVGLERIKIYELSKQVEKLTKWKRTVENAFTAGMLGMEHGSLMGGTILTAHGFITSLRVAMRQAENEFIGSPK
jgi:hypothetical protein